MSIFKDLVHDPELEWQFIDGSINWNDILEVSPNLDNKEEK